MAQTFFQTPGQVLSAGDTREMFLKLFPGLVLAAHRQTSVMQTRHRTVVVPHGKEYTFPAIGRTIAKYLTPGDNLDDQRTKIEHNERKISIDGLLTAEAFVPDLYEAMNHFEVMSEYAYQLGEALAISSDAAVLANLFNLINLDENIPTKGQVQGTGKTGNFYTGAPTTTGIIDADFGAKIVKSLLSAQVYLNENHTPLVQRYFACSPSAYASIVASLLPYNANFQVMATPQTGTLTNIAGFELVPVPHLLRGGADGKHQISTNVMDAKPIGVAFQHGAVGSVQLRGIGVETGRRINFQADQIVARMVVGHGALRPEDAVVITQDEIVI